MDKDQSFQQPPDTGKLTNFHYASNKDEQTDRTKQSVKDHQDSSK
jgi:hypothetical protein